MNTTAQARRSRVDWRAVLGIVLSIACLVWAFRGIDFREVLRHIRAANPLLYLGAVAAATFPFWLRTWRWKSIIVPVYPETKFKPRFTATIVGFMGNNVLPGRVGELLRAYMLARLEPVPVVTSLGSLVVERVFDGVTLVVLTFIALALPSFPAGTPTGREMHHVASILAVAFGIVGVIFVALVVWPRQVVAGLERLVSRFLPDSYCRPIVDALESLLASLGVIRQPLLVARLVFWSAALWLMGALSYWFGMLAFGIKVPFLSALFLQSIVSFAVAIPSSPGFFGIFEAAVRVGLVQLWGVDANRAISFAIGFHVGGYIPVTVMGALYVWRLGISWKEVEKGEEAVEETVEQQLPGAREIVHAPPTRRQDRGGLLDRRNPDSPRDSARAAHHSGDDVPGRPPGTPPATGSGDVGPGRLPGTPPAAGSGDVASGSDPGAPGGAPPGGQAP